MYSPLIPSAQRTHLLLQDNPPSVIRSTVNIALLSEFPLLLSGQIKLQVPVYTVWGACEDVLVLEKFRSGSYAIDNLHVLDEATTRCLDVGGVKLRLLGLGGALVPHKLFDNGEGSATIAGGQGTMWTTALQIGELVDTAQRVFDPTETRLLVTHTSPGREGIIAQLGLVLKADLTISAGLHFRYATSYNEFSVQGDFEGFRHKMVLGKEAFDKIWESVKSQVDAVIDEHQRVLLDKALSVVERLPPIQPSSGPGAAATGEEPAWKNCWNWNLCDAAYGSLVLDIKEGRISAELKSQGMHSYLLFKLITLSLTHISPGFNYAYRRTATVAPTPNSTTVALPTTAPQHSAPGTLSQPPTKGSTPAPAPDRAVPAHFSNSNNASTTQSYSSTPPPGTAISPGKESPAPKMNGASPSANAEKAEREKAKKKEKKERKDKEKAERVEREKAEKEDTPRSASTPVLPESSSVPESAQRGEEVKSPVTTDGAGSTGIRTPKTGRPPRNPWTIFMRMQVAATEPELREFFGEAKSGVCCV